MRMGRGRPDREKMAKLLGDAKRNQEQRAQGYRERALALLPHVCGRCGREFAGKRLRELTVHHKDHNHSNNPADCSNWELLCLYCHDDEHQDAQQRDHYNTSTDRADAGPTLAHNPFEGLADLTQPDDEEER